MCTFSETILHLHSCFYSFQFSVNQRNNHEDFAESSEHFLVDFDFIVSHFGQFCQSGRNSGRWLDKCAQGRVDVSIFCPMVSWPVESCSKPRTSSELGITTWVWMASLPLTSHKHLDYQDDSWSLPCQLFTSNYFFNAAFSTLCSTM